MSKLKKLAKIFDVAVFIVNQVMSDPSGMSMGNDKKPIGGNIMAHSSTTRLALKKGKEGKRIVRIYDSPNVQAESVEFLITKKGVCDE